MATPAAVSDMCTGLQVNLGVSKKKNGENVMKTGWRKGTFAWKLVEDAPRQLTAMILNLQVAFFVCMHTYKHKEHALLNKSLCSTCEIWKTPIYWWIFLCWLFQSVSCLQGNLDAISRGIGGNVEKAGCWQRTIARELVEDADDFPLEIFLLYFDWFWQTLRLSLHFVILYCSFV